MTSDPYEVTRNELLAWVGTGPEPKDLDAVLEQIPLIAADPYDAHAMPVPGRSIAKFTWPVPETYLAVTYLVVEQFHTVRIIKIGRPET